ncbi:AAA-ATPase ASD, mitochondrial-like [Malania oleifera]|uniref:AAA-ATPase ASD, mitochondrial-like n=1 Tax=Malania oleifera TaxID=397392 RepID=UPI0025AEAE98|nr:AAA-ATPase ASD, mitochondrial-like [Malania oleifera]
MGSTGEMWTQLGSAMAGMMFIWAMFAQYFPRQLKPHIETYADKLMSFVYPYIHITFPEFTGERFKRNAAYTAIETYLSANSSQRARRLKADLVKDSQSLVLSMDDSVEVTDEFQGAKLWWSSNKIFPQTQVISLYPNSDERRYYKLIFHKRHQDIITKSYLRHVIDQGKAITVENRQRKLYTNNRSENWYGYKRSVWSHAPFEHPSRFDTLAMEPNKKEMIIKDLMTFSKSKEYYLKIGKAWKRGYLLYGPPGTGKSSMIAAMANLLNYDVYDIELTAIKDNTELRKLLIDTMSKSIIVIEDIDCSLDLAGKRKQQNKEKDGDKEEKDPISKMKNGGMEDSKVTLSGLLNCIDGLWSACGEERIIIFTTNYKENLDPALIRRGRMDKHIELSYCCFEAFKILAKNYLDVDSHHLFGIVQRLLEETKVTPADVAENLMPKSAEEDATICLRNLIEALEKANEEAKSIAEEEERMKAEKDEKAKEETNPAKEGKVKEPPAGKELEGKKTSDKEVKENGITA